MRHVIQSIAILFFLADTMAAVEPPAEPVTWRERQAERQAWVDAHFGLETSLGNEAADTLRNEIISDLYHLSGRRADESNVAQARKHLSEDPDTFSSNLTA